MNLTEKKYVYIDTKRLYQHNANLFINRSIVTKKKRSVGKKEFVF